MPARAGRKALVKIAGNPIVIANEATSTSDFGIYQITDPARRVLDPTATVTVLVGGVPTVESYTLYRLTGTIAFAFINAARGTVTVNASYLPLATVAECKGYEYQITGTNAPDNAFGDTYVTRVQTLLDVSGSLSRWWIDRYFVDALRNDTIVLLQFYSDASADPDLGCWARLSRVGTSFPYAGLSEESIDFEGVVDVDYHAIDAGEATDPIPPPPGLSLALDWAPVAHPDEIALPHVFTLPTAPQLGTGAPYSSPRYIGAGIGEFSNSRTLYPYTRDKWSHVAPDSNWFGTGWAGAVTLFSATVTADQIDGPGENSRAALLAFSSGSGSAAFLDRAAPSTQTEGFSEQKQGVFLGYRAKVIGDVGKQFRVEWAGSLADQFTPVYHTTTITLSMSWQVVGWDSASSAETTGYERIWVYPVAAGPLQAMEMYICNAIVRGARLRPRVEEWGRQAPWHQELGLLSQMGNRNCWWPSDIPVGANGTTVGASTVPAPDSDDYHTARTMLRAQMPNGGDLTAGQFENVYQMDGSDPTLESSYVWLHVYVAPYSGGAMPDDGDLQGYVQVDSGGPLYGPVDLVRDPDPLRRTTDGGSFYRCRIATASEASLKPIIRNASGGALDITVYRCALTPEMERMHGWHSAVVPMRAITQPVANNNAFYHIEKVNLILTHAEFIWGFRAVLPYRMSAITDMGFSDFSPGFWQSGPEGSAAYCFDGSLELLAGGAGQRLSFKMERAEAVVADNWYATIPLPDDPAVFPEFVAFDFILYGVGTDLKKIGIGHGPGTGITWVNHGDTFFGEAVNFTQSVGSAWELQDFMGLAGDRDNIRMCGGWLQALFAGKIVDEASVEASAQAHVVARWGPRLDYR